LLNEICFDKLKDKKGYNLFISNYEDEYKNDKDWFWSCYGDGEFLDFFPIIDNCTIQG
jgi:hypothetical protein